MSGIYLLYFLQNSSVTIKMFSVMSEARATFLQKSRLIFQTKTIVLLCLNHKATPLIRPTPNLKNEMISEISRKNLAEWCIELLPIKFSVG